MLLDLKQNKLLIREIIILGVLVTFGLFITLILSRTTWGCNIDTVGGCSAVSGFEEFLLMLASVVYVLTIIVMPLLILITTIYGLIILRKLEK
jgi:hypothetical protein